MHEDERGIGMSEIIDVFLKIRKRDTPNNVLRCLNYYLGLFSDPEKYSILLYSEDFELSEIYLKSYKVLRKPNILKNMECAKLYDMIYNHSVISPPWRGAAFALSMPYYYSNAKYVLQIDSDDFVITNIKEDQLDKLFTEFKNRNMTTISADYCFSIHPFSLRNIIPSFWTYGVNLSLRENKKYIINESLFNTGPAFIRKHAKYIKLQHEVCLDILVGDYMQNIFNQEYIAFTMKNTTLLHSYFWQSHYDEKHDKIFAKYEADVSGQFLKLNGLYDRHPRTLVIG